MPRSATTWRASCSAVGRSSSETPIDSATVTCGSAPTAPIGASVDAALVRPGEACEHEQPDESHRPGERDGAHGRAARAPARQVEARLSGRREEPFDQWARRADEREGAEHGHLRCVLGRVRRDEQRRQQPDADGVHTTRDMPFGDRLGVGDHEEEEHQDLRGGDEHPPEVRSLDRARGASGRSSRARWRRARRCRRRTRARTRLRFRAGAAAGGSRGRP